MKESMAGMENLEIKRRLTSFFGMIFDLKNEIVLLGISYTIMHGGLFLIPNAIFWDDWVLYRNPPSIIFDTFRQAGSMFNWTAYLHVGMLNIGPWFYKFLTFFLMFFSGIFLNLILIRNGFLKKENRFFVVLLFLVLPLNFARVSLITLPYTICYFLFFLGWYLSTRRRILSLLVFFISFNTNSLLVFYALPFLDLICLDRNSNSYRSFLSSIFHRIDFLILPFLYFFLKTKFFSPAGLYENYHQIYDIYSTFAHLEYAVTTQAKDILNIHINPYNFFLMIPFSFLIVAIKSAKLDLQRKFDSQVLVILVLGIFAIFLAGFPYWILEDAPTFNGWGSRHQLLFPLGISLALVAILNGLGTYAKNIGMAIIVAASLSCGITNYLSFFVDWNKQTELIKLFSENAKIKNSGLIIIEDKTKYLNAINRNYRFYEWNGLLERAYGNQGHFSLEPKDVSGYLNGELDKFFSAHYKAEFYERNNIMPIAFVEIKQVRDRNKIGRPFATLFPKFSLAVSSVDLRMSSENSVAHGEK